ncbi:O-antigen ligase family protein [Jeotgalibacillus campisalis]|uniref:O-antigen ligase-related domain-containing protein n=1 Tax=Jeotgalibacillus campisalis TaxID=220754 RepID=A0A0C2VF54_9BACL|nr:O-antigen ligase family protein [Jeotgalibacillus campisalis]KIL43161.1 hypothetical protein KR50_35640 [Jeotgalibacillus campisalis]
MPKSIDIKILFVILLLLFNGAIGFIKTDPLLSIFDFLENFSPLFEFREIGNYNVYFNNYLIMCLLIPYFMVFSLKNLVSIKLSYLQIFFLMFLIYRLLNDLIVNYQDVLRGELGTVLLYTMYILLFLIVILAINNNLIKLTEMYSMFVNIIVITSIVNSIFIVYQFYIEFTLTYSSFSFFESFRYIRPVSLMGVVTVNSMFIGLGLLILLYKLFDNEFKTRKQKVYVFIGCTIMLLGQFLSGSRGGILAVLIIIIVTLILKYKSIKIKNSMLIFLLITSSIMLLLLLMNLSYLVQYIETVFISDSATGSNNSRFEKWGIAISLFALHPFIGIGTNKFGEYQYAITNGWSNSNPHNVYLQLLAENGLFVFVLFIMIMAFLLFKIVTRKDLNNSFVSLALFYWLTSATYMGTLDNFILGSLFCITVSILSEQIKGGHNFGTNNLSISRLEKS